MADGEKVDANTKLFDLKVKGEIPAAVRALITYTCNGAAFNGASEGGTYAVTATLPQSANYSFTVNGQTPVDGKLEAKLVIKRTYIATGADKDVYQVILVGPEGFYADIKATVTTPTFDRTVLRNYPIHSEFTLTVTGATAADKFVLYIPLHSDFYNAHASDLTADDLYIYEASTNKLVKANSNSSYTVTLEGGRFVVEGYTAAQSTTFVIAPHYNLSFWCTAPGIALIILIVLLVIALMFYIGLVLLRIKANLKENDAIVIDTVGEEYQGEEIVVEDSEGPPAVDVDALAAETEAEVEEAVEEIPAETQDAVDVTIEELAEEAVEEVVEEAPVEEAPVEEAPVEEEAVEAIAVVAEETESDEDEDDDNDDDDNDDEDDEGFGSFGPAGLKYIDIKADPEGYEALLEQERQGLVTVVYRYRKSFTSRLIQSQGNAQDYYSEIKNRLLSYKGIKDRTSWNYDAYNRGRTHVAKINVKTKTVYLYLAINPEDLADTKYNFVDVSAKKKYASVPVLLKIKGDRKFKHALELIDMLCGEKLELKKLEGREDVDYRLPYKTADEMVEEGVMKKLAAGLPVEGAAPAEEAVAVDAPVADETNTEA